MRRLLYIPIIHSEADLGSLGGALAQQSAALSGGRRWVIHQGTVCKFWDSVSACLRSLDPCGLRVYQDGLAAEGQVGRRIAEEAAGRGSKNYQLVLELINRGAELRKTEDPILLLREHESILRFIQQGDGGGVKANVEQYRLQKDSIMEARDKFAAEAIGATLRREELGVLFMGAYHKVASHLAADISVATLKDPAMVEAYLNELFLGQDDKKLAEISEYLIAPVSAHYLV